MPRWIHVAVSKGPPESPLSKPYSAAKRLAADESIHIILIDAAGRTNQGASTARVTPRAFCPSSPRGKG